MRTKQGRVRRGRSSWMFAFVAFGAGGGLMLLPGCPTPPQCTTDADCTQGFCSEAAGNVCVECITDTHCDDDDGCTTDVCDAATCVHTPVECDEGQVCVEGDCLPDEPVIVRASVEGDAVPGATLTATAEVIIRDDSTIESYEWAQANSVEVGIEDGNTDTATVSLPAVGVYKDELLMVLAEPPISEDQLPPNVPAPEGEFPGGLQDRFQVVGLNPFALEETGLVVLEVAVTTTSGTYTGEAEIHTELPWPVNPGIHNVPLGKTVLLYGKTQASYDWALATPGGSSAALTDGTSQGPYFTPDADGLYTVTVTNTAGDAPEDVTLEIYAGTWEGVITGQDGDGLPEAESCMLCHNGGIAADTFTPWAQSGHAAIFSDNVNTSTHYGENCFACHTVGFDPAVANGGIDEAADYQAFLDSGLINNPSDDNWTTVLSDYPATAQLANIQCENCHGPQDSDAHTEIDPRLSISSDVCGACHGEPARHGRFQQWQLSGHANYELAIDEGQNPNCSRCHSGNGFLAWLPDLLDDDPTNDNENVVVTWAEDATHPQTCVICHDPHDVGTVSGNDTDSRARIYGDTPVLAAGFTATDVGNGAICITCHNSRRDLRNDDTWADTVADGDTARAPHGSAQGDVLMGENAYFVDVGTPGNHGTEIEDTCVDCHMQVTDPPDLLSYDLGGTNHTFFASADICTECHTFGPEIVQPGVEADLAELQGLIEVGLLDLIEERIAAGNTIDLAGQRTITDAADIQEIEFGETRGRQAITVTFTDATVVGPLRLPDVLVVDGTDTVIGELYDFADERLPKSGWNWNLVNNDESKGAHNPTFVGNILDASIDEMTALNGA